MQEPKFRGFSKETNSWHYGFGWFHTDYTEDYLKEKGIKQEAILLTHTGAVACVLESMGQYLHILVEGNELYNGDIIDFYHENDDESAKQVAAVKWMGDTPSQYPAYDIDLSTVKGHYFESNALHEIIESGAHRYEIIGNTYEHHHLLQDKTKEEK